LKKTLILSLFAFSQILFSFLANAIVISLYGIGKNSDSFIAAQILPQIVTSLLVSSLNSVWVTKLSASTYSLRKWRIILSRSLGQALLLSSFAAFFLILFLEFIINISYNGFDSYQKSQTYTYSLIFLITMIINVVSSQLVNGFRTLQQFYKVELINIIGSIIFLSFIYLFSKYLNLLHITLLILGKSSIVLILQLFFSNCPKIIVSFKKFDKDSLILMKPVLIGSLIYKFAPFFDRIILSFAPSGSMTIYSLAQSIASSLVQIVDKSFIMPVYINFGNYIKNNKIYEFKRELKRSLIFISILTMFFLLCIFTLKTFFQYSIEVMFNTSNYESYNIWLCTLLLLGFIHSSLSGTIIISGFYAFRDTKTPTQIGIIGVLISFIIKFILFYIWGFLGLVFGISLYYLMNYFILKSILYKKYEFNT
jgi:peptidoglycan biosynthesis protein MviN/MurJ (putative lipid II flippase)